MPLAKRAETFGEMFKRLRIASGQGLGEFCRMYGYSPGNVSKIERGTIKPSDGAATTVHATALRITPDTPEWNRFHDLAALERGSMPDNIRELDGPLLLRFYEVVRGTATREEGYEFLRDISDLAGIDAEIC